MKKCINCGYFKVFGYFRSDAEDFNSNQWIMRRIFKIGFNLRLKVIYCRVQHWIVCWFSIISILKLAVWRQISQVFCLFAIRVSFLESIFLMWQQLFNVRESVIVRILTKTVYCVPYTQNTLCASNYELLLRIGIYITSICNYLRFH